MNSLVGRLFFSQINFFKNAQIPTTSAKTSTTIDRMQVQEMSLDDILNFDQFYNSIVRSVIVRDSGHKKVVKRIYTPNIWKILENKIGSSYFSINRFLYYRKDALKEEEVAYCLKWMNKQNQIKLLDQNGILKHIDQLISIKKITFNDMASIQSILECHLDQHFLSIESLRLIVKQFAEAAQAEEVELGKNEFTEENIMEEITKAFLVACQINYNLVMSDTYLMRVRKLIQKHFKLLTVDTLINYFISITVHRSKLFTETDCIQQIDYYLNDNYDVLTLHNKLTLLNQMSMIEFKNMSNIAQSFIKEFQSNTYSLQELAKIAKSMVLLEPDNNQFWEKMRQDLLKELYLIKIDESIAEITLIVQCIHQTIGLDTQSLSAIYEVIKDIDIQDTYPLKFILMYQFTMKSVYQMELFQSVIDYEKSTFEFKYLHKYQIDKIIEVVKVFICNLQHNTDQIAYKLLLNKYIELVINHFKDEPLTFSQYYSLLLISGMAKHHIAQFNYNKINKHLDDIILESEKRIDRMVMKNDVGVKDGLMLIGMLEYYNIPMKPQAHRKVINVIKERLIEFENEIPQLAQWFGDYCIRDEKLIDKLLDLVITNEEQLEYKELQHISQILNINIGTVPQQLEMLIIQRSVGENEYLAPILNYSKIKDKLSSEYQSKFIFNVI